MVLQHLRDQLGRPVHPVHRLDKGTSGVLLLALDADAAAHLGRQWMAHGVTKDYLAFVRGWPPARRSGPRTSRPEARRSAPFFDPARGSSWPPRPGHGGRRRSWGAMVARSAP